MCRILRRISLCQDFHPRPPPLPPWNYHTHLHAYPPSNPLIRIDWCPTGPHTHAHDLVTLEDEFVLRNCSSSGGAANANANGSSNSSSSGGSDASAAPAPVVIATWVWEISVIDGSIAPKGVLATPPVQPAPAPAPPLSPPAPPLSPPAPAAPLSAPPPTAKGAAGRRERGAGSDDNERMTGTEEEMEGRGMVGAVDAMFMPGYAALLTTVSVAVRAGGELSRWLPVRPDERRRE